MENIYKIKVRSNPDPRELYPSERRYSSSIVLGFSVIFFALAITSSIMGTLAVQKVSLTNANLTSDYNKYLNESNEETNIVTTEINERLLRKVEKDFYEIHNSHYIHQSAIASSGCFVMTVGLILATGTGLFAWKRWYIDNNITWFFIASCFSTMTSAISLLLIILTLMESHRSYLNNEFPQITFGLSLNILIISIFSLTWSAIATRVSFRGMKSSYPDDIVLSRAKGRIEVSTVRIKGNKIAKVIPPDILNHFPTTGKLAKYLPKKQEMKSQDLPKEESNKEYEERVKKFLNEQHGRTDEDSKDNK